MQNRLIYLHIYNYLCSYTTTVPAGDGAPPGAVYALEGSVAYSGSVIQWLRDNLEMIADAKESEALARSVPDNGGNCLVCLFVLLIGDILLP